jgi:PadR family transcriptional regulator, regulatory protein PadR
MSAEALKGHLDPMLLAVLERGPLHGYAVIDAVRTGSGDRFDLPTGTIYPALHRLERAGLVKSTWAVVSGRRRRSYQLTAAGKRTLAHERSVWREFATGVSSLLLESPWPAIP